jgi:hypothetical protein
MLTLVMIMMDTDNDGALSLAEVQAVHARVFNYADGDDDGKLTLEEIQRFFRAAPRAIAADPALPDLRGTWRLEADAVIRGAAPFHPAGAPPPAEGMEPRLRPFTGTLRIDGQEGARFWGVVENEFASEELVGSFSGEGRRFIMADVDGEFDGELLEGGGTFRYCYRHVTPGSRVTACGTGKRE